MVIPRPISLVLRKLDRLFMARWHIILHVRARYDNRGRVCIGYIWWKLLAFIVDRALANPWSLLIFTKGVWLELSVVIGKKCHLSQIVSTFIAVVSDAYSVGQFRGYERKRSTEMSLLTQRHRTQRIIWACDYAKWSLVGKHFVVWFDDSLFILDWWYC